MSSASGWWAVILAVAALVAAAVAWRTRNAMATMGVGMITLWLAQWLPGAWA